MQLFIDSADISEIEWWVSNGICTGVTTNPAIIKRDQPSIDPSDTVPAILRALAHPWPVSVQLAPGEDPKPWLEMGENVVVKAPISKWGLEVAARMPGRTNITAVMSEHQAALAATMNPAFISVFWCRINDAHRCSRPAAEVVASARAMRDTYTKIIVGSIRSPDDVIDAIEAGADIVTVTPKVLREMMQHDATDKILAEWYP